MQGQFEEIWFPIYNHKITKFGTCKMLLLGNAHGEKTD